MEFRVDLNIYKLARILQLTRNPELVVGKLRGSKSSDNLGDGTNKNSL